MERQSVGSVSIFREDFVLRNTYRAVYVKMITMKEIEGSRVLKEALSYRPKIIDFTGIINSGNFWKMFLICIKISKNFLRSLLCIWL